MLPAFQRFIRDQRLLPTGQHLLLAVSGGVDSVVLCDCCHAAGFSFTLAHCNFRLRGAESDRDEAFVRRLGDRYGAAVWVKHFDTRELAAEHRMSIETMARTLRYQWFHELTGEGELPGTDAVRPQLILTGHHADDNIETVVMHFFRGTGLAGLTGMEPRQGKLVRPLLFARRAELEAYARERQLDFVTDSSNASTAYTRNYFRHRVLPLVQEVYPSADTNLLDNISRLREAYILYRESVGRQLRKLVEHKGDEVHIPVEGLRKLPAAHTLLFEIIRHYGFSSRQVPEVAALLDSETGRYVNSGAYRVLRNRRWLVIAPLEVRSAGHILIQAPFDHLLFPMGELQARIVARANWQLDPRPEVACLDARLVLYPLLLRPWKPGDYFYPLGMPKKKKISRLLTDIRCSLVEKENTWVLTDASGKIIWVTGRRIDHRFRVTDTTTDVLHLTFKRKDAAS